MTAYKLQDDPCEHWEISGSIREIANWLYETSLPEKCNIVINGSVYFFNTKRELSLFSMAFNMVYTLGFAFTLDQVSEVAAKEIYNNTLVC